MLAAALGDAALLYPMPPCLAGKIGVPLRERFRIGSNKRSPITKYQVAHRDELPDLKKRLMRYIRKYNVQPKPVKWKYFDTTRRITPDSIVTVH